MSQYWKGLEKSYNSLPDYNVLCLLTIYSPSAQKFETVIGERTKTDADGEHWDFVRHKLKNRDVEVVAWKSIPEPYNHLEQ